MWRSTFRIKLEILSLLVLLVGGCAPSPVASSDTHSQHTSASAASRNGTTDTEEISLELQRSVHASLDCSGCHSPVQRGKDAPASHANALDKVDCGHCHEAERVTYEQSVHAQGSTGAQAKSAQCADCHGTHRILQSSDPLSRTYKRNLPATCGKCHSNPLTAQKLGIGQSEAGQQYVESIHGKALVNKGLLSAPSCADCHGASHSMRRAADPQSLVNRSNLPRTCGTCHTGPTTDYLAGIHATKLAQGNTKAPSCADCHSAHSISNTTSAFRLRSDEICGKCHAAQLRQYLQTYHGRAHDLGSLRVAACFDCHGAHAILPRSDPASSISPGNRLETCRKCHPGAQPAFASFKPHADYMDRKHYPDLFWAFVVMTSLIVGTFAVWGLHNLLWFARMLLAYAKNPAAFRAEKRRIRDERNAKLYTRFRPVDRFCHFLIIISFMILVSTGMPLKFHDSKWAQDIFDALGGAPVAARLHRFGAILSFLYLFIHLASLVGPMKRNWSKFREADGKFRFRRLLAFVFGPDSPLPNFDDLRDIRDHVKYFLGRGPKPQFDRFTYWEKFDYFAELWGSAFIGLSGLVMWFPVRVSYVFPGWLVNLAQIIHSQEALLAAGFILTFHFFNGHFRLEKFPLDSVMFSGRITEAEMKHERGRQYARLQAEGRLQELEAHDDWNNWKYVFNSFGLLALVIGLLLAAVMFLGLTRQWFTH
jgi:cytochrome b subunit of formate dehydrogenase